MPNKLFDAGSFCEVGVVHKCDGRPLPGKPGNTCGTQVGLPNVPELLANRFQEFDEFGFARDLVEFFVACCVWRLRLKPLTRERGGQKGVGRVGQLISGGLSLSFEVVGLASSG